MSCAVVYRCTVCSEPKKQTNHWFAAIQTDGSLAFYTWQAAHELGILQDENTLHLCGEKHAQALLGRFLRHEPETEPYEVKPNV